MEATNYNRNWMFWGSRVIGGDNRIPTLVHGHQRHAHRGDVAQRGHARQQRAVRDRRRDLPPGHLLRDGVRQPRRASGASPTASTLSGQDRPDRGQGRDAQAGGVRGRRVQHRRHLPHERHRLAGGRRRSRAATRRYFTGTALDWIFGASPAKTKDKEKYGQVDGELGLRAAARCTSVKFGARGAEHKRDTHQVAQGPNFAADPFAAANLPRWNGETYPGNFGEPPRRQLPAQRVDARSRRARALGRHLLQPRPARAPVLAGRVRDEGEGLRPPT